MHSFDVVIVGAGAAGLFCAGVAGQLGLKVLVIDQSDKVAEKIRISGGGRSNFTNVDVTAANFLSENPRFAKSALSRYTPQDFVRFPILKSSVDVGNSNLFGVTQNLQGNAMGNFDQTLWSVRYDYARWVRR